jgi:hypothetical protein
MIDEEVHKQKYEIRQLQTRSVTLYPTRATVVRRIEAVKLRVSRYLVRFELKALEQQSSLVLMK